MKTKSYTVPEVFIIESLGEKELRENYLEGKIIEQILQMGKRAPLRHYVKTRGEFENALNEFKKSNYRYLHISSHGTEDKKAFWFHFGPIDFLEFTELVQDMLFNRRLFISACNIANENLASLVIPESGCYSVIGSYEPIAFDCAAMFWSSFYYLAYKEQGRLPKFSRMLLINTLKTLTGLHGINLNYFSKSYRKGVKLSKIQSGKIIS